MKNLKDIITEKLRLDKTIKGRQYTCQPKDWDELRYIIRNWLKVDNDADLNDIDVSKITNMSNLFDGLDPHNIKINEWDVSNVEYMMKMFYMCHNFNCDLSKWDVSNVKDIYAMFRYCNKFDYDLSNWDVSKINDMRCMFDGCKSLKKKPDWYKVV